MCQEGKCQVPNIGQALVSLASVFSSLKGQWPHLTHPTYKCKCFLKSKSRDHHPRMILPNSLRLPHNRSWPLRPTVLWATPFHALEPPAPGLVHGWAGPILHRCRCPSTTRAVVIHPGA